jgi:hypothetical protein
MKNDPLPMMCMDVAPGRIAVCVPPDELGLLRTPWCHLSPGHEGPHQCGQWLWMDEGQHPERVSR